MNEADILINKLQRYYNVGTLQALGEKIGVAQTTISGWSTRNSVKAISRKIYELNLPIESGNEYFEFENLIVDNAIYSAKEKFRSYENSLIDWGLYKPAVNILKDVIKTIDYNEMSTDSAKKILVEKISVYEVSWFSLQAKNPPKKKMISNLIQRYFSSIECYAICRYPEEVFDYVGYWGKEKFDKVFSE